MINKTFKEKVVELIANQAHYEEERYLETGQTYHICRMEMCEELSEAIEALKENEVKDNE